MPAATSTAFLLTLLELLGRGRHSRCQSTWQQRTAMIAGVEGGGTSWKVGLARPDPSTPGQFTIVDRQTFQTTTPAETLGKIHAHLHANRERITAVGIASFGPVDLDRASPTYGFITTTPKPGWKNSDVRGIVMEWARRPRSTCLAASTPT